MKVEILAMLISAIEKILDKLCENYFLLRLETYFFFFEICKAWEFLLPETLGTEENLLFSLHEEEKMLESLCPAVHRGKGKNFLFKKREPELESLYGGLICDKKGWKHIKR